MGSDEQIEGPFSPMMTFCWLPCQIKKKACHPWIRGLWWGKNL